MSANPDLRWQQRFQSFDRAFILLQEPIKDGPAALNQLEKEGIAQRFEYCVELAWKTMKDYLEASGCVLAAVSPKQVVRTASDTKVIGDARVWIDMLNHRNLFSHTFDCEVFEAAVDAVHARYLTALGELREFLRRESLR